MTDAEYRATRARISRYLKMWQRPMGLGQWTISVEFCREPPPDMQPNPPSWGALMDVEPKWQYMVARMRVNMPAALTTDDSELERTVIHELAHCVVAEMRPTKHTDDTRAHEERVVTILEKTFHSLHTDGWNAAKDDLKRKTKEKEKTP